MVSSNRDFAAGFMVLTVGWTLLGFSITPLEPLQNAAPEVQVIIFLLTVLVLASIPLVMILKPWTALVTAAVGIVYLVSMAVLSISLMDRTGPVVSAVLSATFVVFAFRAYREKLP